MYLDPGFGGMLIQAIVAIVATGGVVLFAFRKKLSKFFNKNKTVPESRRSDKEDEDLEVIDMMDDDTDK